MIGFLNSDIIFQFQESFETNCLSLFGDAYTHINNTLDISADWEEENISANFFDYIDKSERAIGLNINISDEHRLYYQSILSGQTTAKSASRIDFRLTTNWTQANKRCEFYIEAKNLIENDCVKKGRKSKLKAKKNHERYINTGIDSFISGKYPQNGCLIGYVLEGIPENIVTKINSRLDLSNRKSENLKQQACQIENLSFYFISSHEDQRKLKHYLIKFFGLMDKKEAANRRVLHIY
jgi:hypothetical protein